MVNKDKLKGGLSDNMSIKDLAKKHDVSVEDITKELETGIAVEMEHVNDKDYAKEIAMDHLYELPDYYSRLNKMEKEAKSETTIVESNKGLIRKLLRESVKLSITDETTDSKMFNIYYKTRKAGHIICGPASEPFTENTMEILDLKLGDDYINLNVATQAVKALFQVYPEVDRLIVPLPPESRLFWEKIGFSRLNDTYHMLFRGH